MSPTEKDRNEEMRGVIMANPQLFNSAGRGPQTDTINAAGGTAYEFTPKHALAQLAATGCLNNTYYTSAQEQLDKVKEVLKDVDTKFVGKVAVYARESGYMKDMPALLCAYLASADGETLEKVFPRVIDNGKMLRNFVQMVRSGQFGRKSFGSRPKRLVRQWLEEKPEHLVFKGAIGNDPSMSDVIKMCRPRGGELGSKRNQMFRYIIGKDFDRDGLPDVIREYEEFKDDMSREVPRVDFRLLDSLGLEKKHWTEIARRAPWMMTRMNLNTFARHGVFEDEKVVKIIANRLRDPEEVKKARAFPYQLMMAYNASVGNLPHDIAEALQDAMEVSVENVPAIEGNVWVAVDVSGSMGSPVTGHRRGATTSVRCVDVAALVAASVLRKNQKAQILPFDQEVRACQLNPRDSILTNAKKLAMRGGATNCSAPLQKINRLDAKVDLVLFVSDNQSWVETAMGGGYRALWGRQRSTSVMEEWGKIKKRCPKAKMVCLDIQPYADTQAAESKDIMNIGGFSDKVFDVVANFSAGGLSQDHWVGEIDKIEL